MAINKSEIIKKIHDGLEEYTISDIELVYDLFVEKFTEELGADNRIEIRTFGVFSPKLMNNRVGINPATGEKIYISAKKLVSYKPSKYLISYLNNE